MWETFFVFHISMPRFWQDSLWCRWPVAQRRMRPLRVIFHAPPLRQNLGLLQRVKNLAVQELISQLAVEALAIPVLPRTSGLDVQRLGPDVLPAFHTSPSMISDEGKGKRYVEEQAHGGADDWGAEAVGSGS